MNPFRNRILIMGIAVGVNCGVVWSQAPTNDVSRDFSLASNPNGVWSYGYVTNIGGAFVPLTVAKTNLADGVPLQVWSLSSSEPPSVFHNGTTNTAITDGGQGIYPPGTVWFYAGSDGTPYNFAVIRFTVPVGGNGTYTINYAVQPFLNGPLAGDTDFHVVKNGGEIFGQFLSSNSSTGNTNTLALAAGDRIDFMVGRGADGSQFGSGLKIQATIVPLQPSLSTIIVPAAMANQEGDAGSGILAQTLRLQDVYGASLFPTNPIVITEIRFRPDAGFGMAFTSTVANIQFNLSTTLVPPDGLSSTFTNNLGSNTTLVFSGPLSISSSFIGPASGPKAFDIIVRLQTPFLYDSSQGNLLLETRNYSGSSASTISHIGVPGDFASRAFALNPNSTSATTINTGADVAQFAYVSADDLPRIISQPQGQTVAVGSNATFSVLAGGAVPLRYQWRLNATNIAGATNSFLLLSNVQPINAGNYSVQVTNAVGSVNSSNAALTVLTVIPAIGTSFDVSRDFSLASNPNSVWTYGYKSATSGPFVPFGFTKIANAENGVPIQYWKTNDLNPSAVAYNGTTNTATSDGGQGVFPPGTVWVSAGLDGRPDNFGAIRFTVPAGGSGDYRVETAVRSYLDGAISRDSDYHVVWNGAEIFGQFLGPNSGTGYTNTLTLAVGDTIDFLVGRGADGQLFASGLKIQATLTLDSTNPAPPVIWVQPQSQTINATSNATFTVGATGTAPLNYQWRFNGTNIGGATNLSLTLINVLAGENGAYSVLISNIAGTVISSNAVLTVNTNTQLAFVVPPGSASVDGAAGSSVLRNRIRLQDAYGASMFPSAPIMIREIRFRPSAAAGQAFTSTIPDIQFNLSTTIRQPESLSSVFANNPGPDDTVVFHGALNLSSTFSGPSSGPKAFDMVVPFTTPFVFDPSAGNLLVDIRNFSGSTATFVDSIGVIGDQTGRAFALGTNATSASTVDYGCDVLQIVYSFGDGPPFIFFQPQSRTVAEGSNVTLRVTAIGSPQLKYQWQFNGAELAGATNASLTLSNAQASTGGGYTVVITNSAGAVTSTVATLTVLLPPAITAHPQSQTVSEGGDITLSVTATGTLPLAYQWRFNGAPVIGATNSSLNLTNVQFNQGGNYSVLLTNAYGSVTSSNAILSVRLVPGFSSFDVSRDFSTNSNPSGVWSYGYVSFIGGTFTLFGFPKRVSAANGVPLDTWTKNGIEPSEVQCNTTTNTAGGGTAVYPPGTMSIHPGVDGHTDNFGVIRFTAPPGGSGDYWIATAVQSYVDGSTSGDADFHVVWNGVEAFGQFLPGNSGTRYTNLLTLAAGDTIDFMVGRGADGQLFNSGLKIQATLSLDSTNPAAPTLLVQPQSQTLNMGTNVSFNAAGNGTAPLFYQWQFNGTNLAGATNSSLTLTNVQVSQGGNYTLAVSNSVGSITSSPALLKITVLFVLGDGQRLTNTTYTYVGSVNIQLQTLFPNGNLFYTLDGSAPSFISTSYTSAFSIGRTTTLRTIAYSADFSQSAEGDPVNIVIIPTYSLSATTAGGGTVGVAPPGGPYVSNSVVTVTATPTNGWTFLGWVGDAGGTNATVNVTMIRNKRVQAVFGTAISTTIAGNGSVTFNPSGGIYPYGAVVQATALPLVGNYFGAWGNAASGNINPLLFTVTNANPTIASAFAPLGANQAALVVIPSGNGRISISPRLNVYSVGQNVNITATPDVGQSFLGWTGDATGAQNPLSVTMNQSKTVLANFTRRPRVAAPDGLVPVREEGFRLTLLGGTGDEYSIEVSTDLVNWSTLATVTNAIGTVEFVDPPDVNAPYRFYRALLLP